MKNFFLVFFAFFFISGLNAQVTPEIQKGDRFAEEFDFGKAIYFYNMAHEMDDQNPVATRRLADIHNKMGDLETSADWYVKTLELDGATDKDMLYYAEALKRLERYEEAIFWYNKYVAVNPNDRRAQEHVRNQEYYLDLWSDSLKYRMHKLEINAQMSTFGVAPFGDNYLFSSNMINPKNSLEGKSYENPYLDIYICSEYNEQFIDAVPLEGEVNSKYHDGPVFFDKHSNTLYITRNNIKKGKPVKDKTGTVNLKIYTYQWVNDKWQDAKELSFNSDDYSTGHPCLSADGNSLYFVSNMPGGYGGTDIYKCYWEGDKWSAPFNLGKNVNTEGDEMFPYVSKEGIIYFASNGHAGLGGLDNFMCEPWGEQWSIAYNLGYPINTSNDDFSLLFVPGSEIGFFSSNRSGTGNDEVYFFKQLDILEQLVVGRIAIDDPEVSLAGEQLIVSYLESNRELTVDLDDDGSFNFVVYPGNEIDIKMASDKFDQSAPLVSYSADEKLSDTRVELGELKTTLAIDHALAGAEGIYENIGELSDSESLRDALFRLKGELDELDTDKINTDEFVIIDDTEMLVLKTEIKGLNIDNVYFGFDSYVVTRDAKSILDEIVFHMNDNPAWKIEIDTHTDSRGSAEYNQILSEHRANAVRKYLMKNKIDAERILSRAHGEKDLITQCDESIDCAEDAHSVNRRAEFRYMVVTSNNSSSLD